MYTQDNCKIKGRFYNLKVMAEEDFERMEDRQEDMREHAQKTVEP